MIVHEVLQEELNVPRDFQPRTIAPSRTVGINAGRYLSKSIISFLLSGTVAQSSAQSIHRRWKVSENDAAFPEDVDARPLAES
jgi:hypothetical protein